MPATILIISTLRLASQSAIGMPLADSAHSFGGMSISPYGAGLLIYVFLYARAFVYDWATQLLGTNPLQTELRAGFHTPTIMSFGLSGEYLRRFTREINYPLLGHESRVDWLTAGIGYEFF